MQPGDLVFVRGNTFFSKLIKKVTGSDITHVALALTDKLIIEADGFKRIYIKKLDYKNYEVVPMNFNIDKFDLYLVCQPYLNKKYDYLNVISLWLKHLLKGVFPVLNIKNRYTCVEFVVAVLKDLGFEINAQTPFELFKAVMQR